MISQSMLFQADYHLKVTCSAYKSMDQLVSDLTDLETYLLTLRNIIESPNRPTIMTVYVGEVDLNGTSLHLGDTENILKAMSQSILSPAARATSVGPSTDKYVIGNTCISTEQTDGYLVENLNTIDDIQDATNIDSPGINYPHDLHAMYGFRGDTGPNTAPRSGVEFSGVYTLNRAYAIRSLDPRADMFTQPVTLPMMRPSIHSAVTTKSVVVDPLRNNHLLTILNYIEAVRYLKRMIVSITSEKQISIKDMKLRTKDFSIAACEYIDRNPGDVPFVTSTPSAPMRVYSLSRMLADSFGLLFTRYGRHVSSENRPRAFKISKGFGGLPDRLLNMSIGKDAWIEVLANSYRDSGVSTMIPADPTRLSNTIALRLETINASNLATAITGSNSLMYQYALSNSHVHTGGVSSILFHQNNPVLLPGTFMTGREHRGIHSLLRMAIAIQWLGLFHPANRNDTIAKIQVQE